MAIPSLYVAVTEELVHTLSLSHEMVHFWGALMLYALVAALALSRQIIALPFAAVAAATLANEGLQALHHGSWRMDDTIADIMWTLSAPAVLMAATAVYRAFLPVSRVRPEPVTG